MSGELKMKRRHRHASSVRGTKGALLNEFGPALYILFIGVFFPLLDLVSLSFVYGLGFTLNYFQSCQCAAVPKSEATDPAGRVMFGIPQQWKQVGLGRFVPLEGDPQTTITYKNGQLESNGVQDINVVVSTTITANPLLCVPMLPGIPGLTAPITFNFACEQVLENPDDATS
jgi:hypothetical protein